MRFLMLVSIVAPHNLYRELAYLAWQRGGYLIGAATT
jgi:hypothetical protein